jgi:hypothetical protein
MSNRHAQALLLGKTIFTAERASSLNTTSSSFMCVITLFNRGINACDNLIQM